MEYWLEATDNCDYPNKAGNVGKSASYKIKVLPPVDANERPKGIAEVVMNPVVPALVNAIFDATGHRFGYLPVKTGLRFSINARRPSW